MSGINRNIDNVVNNFNGGSVQRNDLAPAIVFTVAVCVSTYYANSSLR